MSKNHWLLLEKSDETRVSKGIDGFHDQNGKCYRYDNLVHNYKNLASGDSVVLRKENEILGIGEIVGISEDDDTKTHGHCPECRSTDFRERTPKQPKWKCSKCTHEFSEPEETIVEVRATSSRIGLASEVAQRAIGLATSNRLDSIRSVSPRERFCETICLYEPI